MAGLTVGHANDPAEHAADALAESALARLRRLSRWHDDGEGAVAEPDAHVRRAPTPGGGAGIGAAGGVLDDVTSARIEARLGAGAPLPGDVLRRMETAFDTSLGHVRVHDGSEAAHLSSAVAAQAFTTGRDIFFGAGQYDPADARGERILAHEIAHVLQEPPGLRRHVRR